MNEHFLTYEQSLAVKELGFDEPCMRLKNDIVDVYEEKSWCNWNEAKNLVSIPLKSQFFKWVREKYGILGVVNIAPQGFYYYDINKIEPYKEINQDVDFDSFEEAEDECINHIIKLIKKYYDISSRTITKYTKK